MFIQQNHRNIADNWQFFRKIIKISITFVYAIMFKNKLQIVVDLFQKNETILKKWKKNRIVSLFDENHKHDQNRFDVNQNETFRSIEFEMIFAKRNSDSKKNQQNWTKKKSTLISSSVKNSERKK